MTSKLQNTLVIIGLIAVAAMGYYLFIQNGSIALDNNAVDNQVAVETGQFLQKLNELKLIKLDGTIFADPRFISLIDSSVPVVPVEQGRVNPFVKPN